MTFDADEELTGGNRVIDLPAEPAGVADVEFEPPTSDEIARPATFD